MLDGSGFAFLAEKLFELFIRQLTTEPDTSPELDRNKNPDDENEQNQQL